jgi:competence protein ComEC
MLIDGGSEDAGAGQRAVAPSLWSRGIRNIDYLVVSHPHPDHFGGLYYILDNFEIGEVWAIMNSAYTAREFFNSVAAKGITLRTPVRGDFSDENSHSLVLKIESEGTSILFTGDIEEEAEGNVLALGKWLKSEIIKVPHHGGRTSSSTEFLKAVNPDIAVVSAGKNNPFHHPHQKTLERYKGEGVILLRTDFDGAITINGRDGYYEVSTYKDSRFQKAEFLQDELRNVGLLFF